MPDDAIVLALVVGATERARIREAFRSRAEVVFLGRTDQMERHLATDARPLIALVVEPRDQDGRSAAEMVSQARSRTRRVPIIGYCHVGFQHSSDIRALAAAGVHELVFHGVDDSGVALRSILSAAEHACAAEAVTEAISPHVPRSLHAFVEFAVRQPHHAHTVDEVAYALGINRRTLANYSMRGGTLPPAELLGWCRLLLAAYYLGTTARTVESIALQLDFASDTALRNMMKRYTGMRAVEVRNQGGMLAVLKRMLEATRRHSPSGQAHLTECRTTGC